MKEKVFSPIFRWIIFVFSVIISAILCSALVTEGTVNGKVLFGALIKSKYLIILIIYLIIILIYFFIANKFKNKKIELEKLPKDEVNNILDNRKEEVVSDVYEKLLKKSTDLNDMEKIIKSWNESKRR